jgi:predicted nucleotidyltransferase
VAASSVPLDRYRTVARDVLADEPVVAAYLYGSRARGEARPDSDVDVAVLVRPEVPPEDYLTVSLRLARRLEAALRERVDAVVVLNDAPLRLQYRVLRDGILLHVTEDDARLRYEAATYPMAMDFEVKAAALDEMILAAHAEGRR